MMHPVVRRIALALLAVTIPAAPSLMAQAAAPVPPLDVLARRSLPLIEGELSLRGLKAEVSVVRDRWGIAHIYAANTDDLFFAQGFVAAQDRLWQMEMWRRAKEGTLAEVLGPRAVARDRMARLLRYRGPMDDTEWTSYHPEGKRIMTAFAAGVNAFIAQGQNEMPVEFQLTGIAPTRWTAETPTLRDITFGDAPAELRLAREIARTSVAEASARNPTSPRDLLKVPAGLDPSLVTDAVIASTGTAGGTPRPPVLPQYRGMITDTSSMMPSSGITDPGSNNWVVSGRLSKTGRPIVANDPHREVAVPALRYLVHLNAPGWNVIGAGEAAIPGVAIGHNDRIAWGLTIVGTDQHDIFVEELNPANHSQVKWKGKWESLRIVRDTIRVKDAAPEIITMKFSRHGPIFHEDSARHRAYALRSALHEPGTAPYLGALRVNQTPNCRVFLDAVMYWKAPTENMICGDVEGNISWQASALTPNRAGWTGRLPVPGTGEYEWAGFRKDLPRELNPSRGFIATANNDIHPPGYQRPIMYKSAAPSWRIMRLTDVLSAGAPFSIADFQKLQHDEYSRQAATELALFRGWTGKTKPVERARAMVAGWDAFLRRESAPAAIYMAWRSAGGGRATDAGVTAKARDSIVVSALERAIEQLTREQGADWAQWRWGRSNARAFPHSFVAAYNLPTVERGGGGTTVAANGATYREIIDVGDWDKSIATSTPGQSGQPGSPFYGNLLPLWTKNEYFPLLFSPSAVSNDNTHRLVLRP